MLFSVKLQDSTYQVINHFHGTKQFHIPCNAFEPVTIGKLWAEHLQLTSAQKYLIVDCNTYNFMTNSGELPWGIPWENINFKALNEALLLLLFKVGFVLYFFPQRK